jgi:hypothetical protein
MMSLTKRDKSFGGYFVVPLGYSLVLHVAFGLVILYSFQINPFMNHPPEDYLIVKLTRETEIPVELKEKDVIKPKEKQFTIKKEEKPELKEPLQPVKMKEELPLPAEVEPPPVPEQIPEPVEPMPLPSVREVAPSEPLLEEVKVELPPIVNQPVMPLPEPELLELPTVINQPVMPLPEPEPIELLPMVNQPVMPLPEPQLVIPFEEPVPLPPVEEVTPTEPLLEEVEVELPPMVNLPLLPLPEIEPVPETEEPPLFSEATEVEIEQDQLKTEVHDLIEEDAPVEPVHIDAVAPMIVITEPQDGTVFNINRDKAIAVRGTIDDPDITMAIVVLNGKRIEVEVQEGRFETMFSEVADENTLMVEAINKSGRMGQSSLIRFLTIRPELQDIQVVLSCRASCGDIRLTALEGPHPQSRNYRPFKPPIKIKDSTVDYENDSPYIAKLMAVQKSRSGVYTIRLDANPSHVVSDCDPHMVVILYGYDSERVRTKVFHPSSISDPGKGPWISAKFLMPQGFFWDDDDWTTGQIEDSRSRTKFNNSLGIVWKELK